MSDSGSGRGRTGDEPVGSVAEEAARLLGALRDWSRESSSAYGGDADSAVSGAADAMRNLTENMATDGRECRYCPLCQAISAIRGTNPEVRQHLSTAATSLMHAAAKLLETQVPEGDHGDSGSGRARPSGGRARRDPAQKIDLSDDSWEDG